MRVMKTCPSEYRERVESVLVPENGRIRTSTEKKEESVRVMKNCPGEYQNRVESGGVPEKGIILASTEKLSRRVPEKGSVSESTEIGRIRASTRKR